MKNTAFPFRLLLSIIFILPISVSAQPKGSFNSQPITDTGDLSALMVEGINNYLTKETERVTRTRGKLWQYDFASSKAFNRSIQSQRNFLAKRCGVADTRITPQIEILTDDKLNQFKLETKTCVIRPVSWSVLDGLSAEGLLLQPKGEIRARVVLIPDASVLPEVVAGLQRSANTGYFIGQKLVEVGIEVLIPLLVNREDTFSGSQKVGRFTNQPHREWIYRQGFEVGRHVIGYELQKIFAAIDWMESRNKSEGKRAPIGVAGHGEGGLLALHASAIDTRISSTLVSGYFNTRENVWEEPIYRNIFGSLKYFGDAELAIMSWPRNLVLEHAVAPEISGPPSITPTRKGAAPGRIVTPEYSTVTAEVNRAREMLPPAASHIQWIHSNDGTPLEPFSHEALWSFAKALNVVLSSGPDVVPPPIGLSDWVDTNSRQERTVRGIEKHVQHVLRLSEQTRNQRFWKPLENDTASHVKLKSDFRQQLGDQIGRLPTPHISANPKSRVLEESDKWTRYEIQLDVWPEVFAWGILTIPKGIKNGEQYPVVVCQHGLEGLPMDIVSNDPKYEKHGIYQGLATVLAEKGYITFSPHNPYRGQDRFRVLQRKANPLGLSLFSVIVGQHQRIVEWLQSLSFVDPERVGFYGLSYGGKTAMRVPALVEGYALSVCSADFNEWVRKNVSTEDSFSYMFTGEYEMPEWDLGHTFNYAEMAALIAPRPFMVERGHFDGVGRDEWVGYEFAKVRRHYDLIGLPQKTRIEYFNGAHRINGVGTFEFLDKHLWEH